MATILNIQVLIQPIQETAGIVFMGALQSKPLHTVRHIFRLCLFQVELELINFCAISGNNCCYGNSFFLFFGLVIGTVQAEPLQRFLA